MPVELKNVQRRLRLKEAAPLVISESRLRLDVRRIKRIVQELLEVLGRGQAEVSILFVDDRKMLEIHQRWMGEATPTDVLSFPMGPAARDGPEILGDIVISVETAARRAPKNVLEEIIRTLIHGLLHLVGYDHVRLSDRRRMNRESRRLRRIAHAVA